MPFEPKFKYEQLYDNPNILRITDISTSDSIFDVSFDSTFYTDAFLNKRVVYIRKADGTYLTPKGTNGDYIVWDDTTTIDLDILDKDYALEIKIISNPKFYPYIFSNIFTSTFN